LSGSIRRLPKLVPPNAPNVYGFDACIFKGFSVFSADACTSLLHDYWNFKSTSDLSDFCENTLKLVCPSGVNRLLERVKMNGNGVGINHFHNFFDSLTP
jgi:hypothetical protein